MSAAVTTLDHGLDARTAFDAGWQAALDFVSDAPSCNAFVADAAQRALAVRAARLAADERLARLDAAEKVGPAEYARERAAQALVAYHPQGVRASWLEYDWSAAA